MTDDFEEQDREADSGPFCRHWCDPSDCDELCAKCAHQCRYHGVSNCELCDCEGFEEKEEDHG